ncbi:hypothetical protein BOX15_Mlig024016g2, partial [Macrostomum lignano]
HMEVIAKERRNDLKLWYQAAKGGLTKELAEKILGDFRASTDFPAAHFYPELMKIYPNAKFVLSIRDPKRWVVSVRSTIAELRSVQLKIPKPVDWLLGMSSSVPVIDLILEQRLGFRFDMSEQEMIAAYE